MKSTFFSLFLLAVSLSSCYYADSIKEKEVDQKSEMEIINKRAEQENAILLQLSAKTGFDKFSLGKGKHDAAELRRFYKETLKNFKNDQGFSLLKHRMLYTLIHDYDGMRNLPKDQLMFYFNEVKALPELDANLVLPIVDHLKAYKDDPKVKDIATSIVLTEKEKLADLEKMNNDEVFQTIVVKGNTPNGSPMSAEMKDLIKKQFIKDIQNTYNSTNELVKQAKTIQN